MDARTSAASTEVAAAVGFSTSMRYCWFDWLVKSSVAGEGVTNGAVLTP